MEVQRTVIPTNSIGLISLDEADNEWKATGDYKGVSGLELAVEIQLPTDNAAEVGAAILGADTLVRTATAALLAAASRAGAQSVVRAGPPETVAPSGLKVQMRHDLVIPLSPALGGIYLVSIERTNSWRVFGTFSGAVREECADRPVAFIANVLKILGIPTASALALAAASHLGIAPNAAPAPPQPRTSVTVMVEGGQIGDYSNLLRPPSGTIVTIGNRGAGADRAISPILTIQCNPLKPLDHARRAMSPR